MAMKTSLPFAVSLVVTPLLLWCGALPAFAQGETNATASASTTAAAAPIKLPFGAEDVLKLSQARITEDVILNYVQSSGTIYNLTPADIVYLRNEGVSDKVVNAMIDQRKKVAESTTPVTPQPESPVPAPATVAADTTGCAVAPTYTEPVVTEVAPAASTVYVIPYPAARTAYFGAYSYYRPYGYVGGPYYGGVYYGGPYYRGYCGPSVYAGAYLGGRGHGHRYHH
jgi:hypothetical protein